MKDHKSRSMGQALIEYLAIFAFIGLFSVNLATNFNELMNESVRKIAFALTQQLSIGICGGGSQQDSATCFFGGYKNR